MGQKISNKKKRQGTGEKSKWEGIQLRNLWKYHKET